MRVLHSARAEHLLLPVRITGPVLALTTGSLTVFSLGTSDNLVLGSGSLEFTLHYIVSDQHQDQWICGYGSLLCSFIRIIYLVWGVDLIIKIGLN